MKDDFTNSALPESSLSMLIAAARRHMKHAVEKIGDPYGLNPYQCWMLLLLRDRGAMSLSELAGRMWMDHPTTSRLVHAMEELGLFQIQPDPTHGRKVLIGINPEKGSLVEEIYSKVIEYRSKIEKGMTAEEKSILHSALAKMIVNLTSLLDEGAKENGNQRHRERTSAQVVNR
jgi:DNA-binding MarR family transcriptional regulator